MKDGTQFLHQVHSKFHFQTEMESRKNEKQMAPILEILTCYLHTSYILQNYSRLVLMTLMLQLPKWMRHKLIPRMNLPTHSYLFRCQLFLFFFLLHKFDRLVYIQVLKIIQSANSEQISTPENNFHCFRYILRHNH